MLVAARLGQAVAGSLVLPNAIALLRDALPDGRRAAGFGLLGSAVGAAAAIGPAAGGALAGWLGLARDLPRQPARWWSAAAVLTLRALPAGAPAPARTRAAGRRDWTAAAARPGVRRGDRRRRA